MLRRDEGTVLLSTLLVMSVMSAVALALLTTVQRATTRTGDLQSRAQAELYLNASRDFALSQLAQVAQLDGPELNAQLSAMGPIVLPFENGSIALSVTDGTQCFRLSALSDSSGAGSDAAQGRFASLLEAVGVDNVTASGIAASAVDWVDRDTEPRPGGAEDGTYLSRLESVSGTVPHRTANVPMQSVSELRAINGMDEAIFRTVRPHLCIGEPGVPTRFNINTAEPRHAPVLAAILGGGRAAERAALALIQDRPSAGYQTLDEVPALQGYDNPAAQLSDVVFAPERIAVEVMVRFGDVQRAQFLAYEGLDSGQPTLSYRGYGLEDFPSIAWNLSGSEETTP